MTQMTAEVADGILVMPFNSGRHFRERTLPAIELGLSAGGRKRDDFEIVVEAIMAVGETDEQLEAAGKGVRGLLSFYGSTPSYKPVLDVEGWGDLQPELNAMSKRGEWAAMPGLITDQMVDTIAVVGTPDECGREIVNRFGAISRPCACCYFPGYPSTDDDIAALVAAINEHDRGAPTHDVRLRDHHPRRRRRPRPHRHDRDRHRRGRRDRGRDRTGARRRRRAVVLAACTPERTQAAAESIRSASPALRSKSAPSISRRSTRCARLRRRYRDRHDQLQLLVNNAGVMDYAVRAHRRRLRDAVRHQPPRPLRARHGLRVPALVAGAPVRVVSL